ncbi:alpha/beta hydrolase [Agaribacterium haliotis]|uniref:alpha/beta hydrolase n=1 Tax=Agaribacterium haliotis TaxID=2013869 RepID=UPI0013042160|nr:alpha/beta hydrolase [Agaribacterium haliotis]
MPNFLSYLRHLAAVLALSFSCSALMAAPETEAALPGLSFEPCARSVSSGWSRRAECASTVVPLDYQQPEAEQIELSIVRLKSRRSQPERDPMLMLAGGPGQAASEAFLFADHRYPKLIENRDIYLIDQRGTGDSTAMRCEAMKDADLSVQRDWHELQRLTDECLQQLPADPRFFTTSVAIRDFEYLRKQLGIDQWNLLGVSYGTRVAQHYLRQYPNAIRSVVLDSVLPPDMNFGPDIALESEKALQNLFLRCEADKHCAEHFPDLSTRTRALLQKLKNEPVLQLQLEDLNTGLNQHRDFSHEQLVGMIRLSLYSDESMALLPLLLYQASNGNVAPLARTAWSYQDSLGEAINLGMHNAVVCSEDYPFYRQQDIDIPDLERSYMGPMLHRALVKMCERWPQGPVDDDFKQLVSSDKPVLLISGELDPITPPAYAERAKEKLTNARHVVLPGQGHSASIIACAPDLVAEFVNRASAEALPIGCVIELQASAFFLNFNGPFVSGVEGRAGDKGQARTETSELEGASGRAAVELNL